MISSVKNPKVQQVKALLGRAKDRRQAGAFVIEGVRLAEEALASGWPVRQAFYTAELDGRGQNAVRELKARRAAAEEVSTHVMEAMADTKSPQGLLLELELRELPLPAKPSLVLVLDGVGDPGNMGTLLRSAAAAATDAVILAPGSVDAFAPKVLRSGMGAHFRLPIVEMDWGRIAKFLSENKLATYIAEADAGKAYDDVDLAQNVALVIGGEAHGLSGGAERLNATPVQIPMPGKIESLNAATAGSLLLFEAVRQRRKKTA
jgi:TrmH family RNA methyltransferase